MTAAPELILETTALVPAFRQRRAVCSRCKGPYTYDHVCHDMVRSGAFERVLEGLRELDELPSEAAPHIELLRACTGYGDVLEQAPADDLDFWNVFFTVVGVAAAWERLDHVDRRAVCLVLEKAGREPPWISN